MSNLQSNELLSFDNIDKCIQILQFLCENGDHLHHLTEDQILLLSKYSGQFSRPDRAELKKRNKALRKNNQRIINNENKTLRENTGIRKARSESIYEAPLQIGSAESPKEKKFLNSPRNCYVCKAEFIEVHHFYDSMCNTCAEFNYAKRFQHCDLTNQVAIITGSRLKIGFHAALKLLRSGATVIATTRFPIDSALRYSKELDYHEWKNRLHIYGLDLRHIPSVEIFCRHIYDRFDRLDILINNAAQTVRRPPGFYKHLMENENKSWNEFPEDIKLILSHYHNLIKQIRIGHNDNTNKSIIPVSWEVKENGVGITSSAELSQIPYKLEQTENIEQVFPTGHLDIDLQQVDLRKTNSWRLKLGDIDTAEMIEVQLVNAIAPFVLNNRLINLMKKENTGQKHIVNVTAMEGKFYRFTKAARHPHTNMAKAALNMMTHTAASELEKFGIFINAVDTGWVTDEDPIELAQFKTETHDFQPPLDIVDGAARICDPLIDGILTGKHWNGKFLKDYFPIDW